MNQSAVAILDHMSALAEPTRTRILLLLERHELTVTELCAVLQLPQSTTSRHLRALADAGWVTARAEGTSNWYTMFRDGLDAAAERLWRLVREQAAASPAAAQDHRRLEGVLAKRRTTSQAFFSSSAGQWDRLRDELFGERFHLLALPGLAGDDCSSAGLDPGATAQQACPDDGCDEPCPGEDEDGSCCLVLTASTAVLGSPPDATPAWTVDGPDLWAFRIGLLAQGPRSRIFHPPRRMLS